MLSLVVLLSLLVAQVLERAVTAAAPADPSVNNPFNGILTNFVTETNAAGVVTAQSDVVTTSSSSTTTSSPTTTPSSTSSSSSSTTAVSTTLQQAYSTSTSRTSSAASTSSPQPSHSGLTTGAKAGIGVGVAIGILLIAAGAFYFGKREKVKKESVINEVGDSPPIQVFEEKKDVQPEMVIKPELHEQQAPTPELPGSPVLSRQAPIEDTPKEMPKEAPKEGSWEASPVSPVSPTDTMIRDRNAH
ncbi:MAG: hypothetical protein Q9191_002274 [Dirinaria sp. TL-2023a]